MLLKKKVKIVNFMLCLFYHNLKKQNMVNGKKKERVPTTPANKMQKSLFRIKEHIFRRLDKKKNYIMGLA